MAAKHLSDADYIWELCMQLQHALPPGDADAARHLNRMKFISFRLRAGEVYEEKLRNYRRNAKKAGL